MGYFGATALIAYIPFIKLSMLTLPLPGQGVGSVREICWYLMREITGSVSRATA